MMGMGGGGSSGGGGALPPSQEVEITSDTRTRAVIVKASREYIAIMDDVVRQLDQDPTEALSTYVVPVKNHTATELATTFQNLMRSTGTGGQSRTSTQQSAFGNQQLFGNRSNTGNTSSRNTGSTRSSSSTRSTGTRTRNLGPIQEEGGQDAAPAGESQDEEMPRRALEGQVDVQADTTTNSLVIRTSPRNFQAIQSMLNDLDRMRPQVLIKVLITEVTLDDRTKFGVEGFWENKMTVRGGDKANNRLETDFPLLARQGFTYLLSGDEFQATLNAFASEGKLRVMATPRIMVLDNQTANINVGKEVPIITNSTINSLGNPVNTVQYQSVGIMLDVTPHINPDGLVTMLVAPEISDIASASESVEITPGATSPTFNVNNATTTVAVRSGTTVVIGGLIRETTDDAVQKIPLFGDIPVLGVLFSNTSKIKVKRELMIFLTPYVAFTAAEIEEITELEKSRLKILDLRDIDSESDRWLERLRH
jgi:general secretion pathway protein D